MQYGLQWSSLDTGYNTAHKPSLSSAWQKLLQKIIFHSHGIRADRLRVWRKTGHPEISIRSNYLAAIDADRFS